MSPALRFDGVTKVYRKAISKRSVLALDRLSLTVERGEIFGFLGANAAGKTTAIHIAMGFTFASEGGGTLLGSPFGDLASKRRVGFLPENVPLHFRPASGLLSFYGSLNGMSNGNDQRLNRRIAEVLELLGLSSRANDNVKGFSRGMQQKVGLAQALVNDPELLILDEPTSALDPVARAAVRELLLRLRENGKTVFFSSHQLSDVEQICDRVAILCAGRIVAEGTLQSLLAAGDECVIRARNLSPDKLPSIVAGNTSSPGQARLRARLVEGELLEVAVPRPAQRECIERIWSAGGEIISLNPSGNTLEALFLELAGGGEHAADGAKPGSATTLANSEQSGSAGTDKR